LCYICSAAFIVREECSLGTEAFAEVSVWN